MTETTTAKNTAAPLTSNMHALFTAAMTPYMDGDQEPTTDLVEALLEAINSAEPTPGLIRTLHQIITATDPTDELLGTMHNAIGAAIGLGYTPAPVPTYAARTTSGRSASAARPGSIREQIAAIFAEHPGQAFTTTQLANTLARSGGAIGAALDTMLGRGEAVLTGESPKRYRAATDTHTPTTPDTAPAANESAASATGKAETAPNTETPQATGTSPETEAATPAETTTTDAPQDAPAEEATAAPTRRTKK